MGLKSSQKKIEREKKANFGRAKLKLSHANRADLSPWQKIDLAPS